MNLQEKIAIDLFGMTPTQAQEKGICIDCKKPIAEMEMDHIDEKEYKITALCPKCFDEVSDMGEE